ncbi:hypothetical protein [Pseudomonas sp. efr-133-TYG-5]|uniref:hypothetical protein n=1 Tax=Pseudomonas sp. efr-133-TYG-5 TaxID=3040310 RepID=UPI0025544DCC|nr:hypothetical protein [Pseudomonas sp. efr-133-TYG-5]
MTCISNIAPLAPPTLEPAHAGGINLWAAANLTVAVAPYSGMDRGDLVELFWDGCYVAACVVAEADIGKPLKLKVPESFIVSGWPRLHYRVMQVGRKPALSASARVEVKLDCPGGPVLPGCAEENQYLRPVILPTVICRRGVNPSQIRRGVPLTIAPYLNMAEGDEITLRWGDARMDLPRLTRADVGQAIQVWVPPAVIVEAGEDLRLDVTYCVLDRVGNNSRWAPPRTLKIGCVQPCLNVTLRPAPRAVETRGK